MQSIQKMKHDNISHLFSVTEVELVYRNKRKPSDRPVITNSKIAYDLFVQSWDLNKIELLEQFKIILLDRKNSCIGISDISTGGVSYCVVDPKIVFSTALKAMASGIILAHNHPSGNTKPSGSDEQLTKKLAEAGELLEIKVLDHLVITSDSYTSFADEGLIPF